MKIIDLAFDKDFVVSEWEKRSVDYFWLEDENRFYMTKAGIVLEKNLFEKMSHFHQAITKIQKIISKDLEALKKILPENMANIVFQKPWNISDFQRYDLLIDENWDYKVIELNSETPAGFPEASCNDLFRWKNFSLDDSNKNLYENIKNSNSVWVIFSDDEGEDYINACFQASRFSFSQIINIENLELEEDWIFLDWVKIEKIFSFYPLEWIFADEGWEKFWELYLKGEFELINWPINLITQSKKFWAYICENFEKFEKYFDESIGDSKIGDSVRQENNFLAKNFIPISSFEKKENFLPKPALEREWNNIWNHEAENVVYQQYIEQKKFLIKTFEWEKFWYITLWIYCKQQKAIWTYNRFCENKITDYTSYYLPAYFDENT